MPPLNYGTNNFDRDIGNFPSLPVVNMVLEEVPTETGATLQSRPGLEEAPITMGAGPVKTLYQIDGVLDGSLFGVSAGKLYKNSTEIGTVAGSGPAKIAGYETYVFATSGNDLYAYNGAAHTEVTTPDDFEVIDICVGSSRLIVIKKDSGRFYWSDSLTENIDALSFATAENSPDKLKACLFIGDTLMLFGTETIEFWPASAVDPTLPFIPLVGRTYQVGIRDTGCATMIKGTFAWITNKNEVCIMDPNQVVSSPSLEEKLAESSSASLWTFRLEGTEYLAVTMDTETWVWSSRSSTWSIFESQGETNFVPRCATREYFGSSIDGNILRWSSDYVDLGGPLKRSFRAGMPIDVGRIPVNSLIARVNAGSVSDILVYGGERIINGTFETDEDHWDRTNATLSWSAGRLRVANNTNAFGFAYQAITTTVGEQYRLTAEGFDGTSTFTIRVGTTAGGNELDSISASGTIDFIATTTTTYVSFRLSSNLVGRYAELDNVSLRQETYPYRNPIIEMRTSKDGGKIFGAWRQRTLGTQGDYRHQPKWLSLGSFGQPGVLIEFRVTAPVPFRVSNVLINEPGPGV